MSSNPQAPPPGGGSIETIMLDSALSESSLIIHNPPDIPVDAEILSVCAMSEENATQGKYGYIALDFVAWKVLFHAVGDRAAQNWFSTLDMPKLLAANGYQNLVHQVLGPNGDFIVNMPANTRGVEADFLGQVAARARAADERKTTLFIMVFAPVTPEQDICVDFEPGRMAFITTDMVRDAIRGAIGHNKLPVVFMTASPLTGGWMCNPSLLGLSTGASQDSMLRLISQSCGAVFADYFMNVFTKRGTPFLTDEQRAKFRYDDITPIWATEVQTNTLHKVQRGIHELLEQRHTILAEKHNLDFKLENDAWPCLRPRTSRPLQGFWARKWNQPEDMDIDKVDRFGFLGQAFGDSRMSQIFHLKYLAKIELATCPGDWALTGAAFTKELFRNFLATAEPDEVNVKRVYDAIEFRASSMTLAHILAQALGLPIPGARCRHWSEAGVRHSKFQTAFAVVHNLFGKVAVLPGEIRNELKCVKFFRSSRWLSAAIANKFEDSSDVEIQKFVEMKVAPLVNRIRQTQFDLVKENKSIARLGMEWIAPLIDILPDQVLDATTSHPANGSAPKVPGANLTPPMPVVQPEKRHENVAGEAVERKDRIKQKLAELEAKKAAEKAAEEPKPIGDIVEKPAIGQGHSVDANEIAENPAKVDNVLAASKATPAILATPAPHPVPSVINSGAAEDKLRGIAEEYFMNNRAMFVEMMKRLMVNEPNSVARPATAEAAVGASTAAQTIAAVQSAASTSGANGSGDTGTSDRKTEVDAVATSINPTPPQTPYNERAGERTDAVSDIENMSPTYVHHVSESPESGVSEPGPSESAGPLVYGDAFWAKVGW